MYIRHFFISLIATTFLFIILAAGMYPLTGACANKKAVVTQIANSLGKYYGSQRLNKLEEDTEGNSAIAAYIKAAVAYWETENEAAIKAEEWLTLPSRLESQEAKEIAGAAIYSLMPFSQTWKKARNKLWCTYDRIFPLFTDYLNPEHRQLLFLEIETILQDNAYSEFIERGKHARNYDQRRNLESIYKLKDFLDEDKIGNTSSSELNLDFNLDLRTESK